jgi:hypothetical protein
MIGYELIANFRRNQLAHTVGINFHNACAHNSEALVIAAVSYRYADKPGSQRPKYWPFDPALWRPQDKLTNLVIAGALYQEACEFKEKQLRDGSLHQHAAIEVAEEINNLLITHSRLSA